VLCCYRAIRYLSPLYYYTCILLLLFRTLAESKKYHDCSQVIFCKRTLIWYGTQNSIEVSLRFLYVIGWQHSIGSCVLHTTLHPTLINLYISIRRPKTDHEQHTCRRLCIPSLSFFETLLLFPLIKLIDYKFIGFQPNSQEPVHSG
jgi:hypothetical protein